MIPGRVVTSRFTADELIEGLQDLTIDLDEEPFDFPSRTVNDQAGFVERRLMTLAASQQLVKKVFDNYVPEGRIAAAEFGSGAWGCFYNFLLPKRLWKYWRQYEINPRFVENNKQFARFLFSFRKPSIEVGNFYEMPFDDSSQDLIAGLSSWDGLSMPKRAAAEIARCLKDNGLFIHFQDIAPGEGPLYFESRRRFQRGLEPAFEREDYVIRGPFGIDKCLFGVESIEHDSKMVRTSLYMSELLASALAESGLEIVHCGEMTGEAVQKRRRYEGLFRRIGLYVAPYSNRNYVETAPCREEIMGDDPFVQKENVQLRSSMDVIIARKK